MDINKIDLSGLTAFYRSILTSWTVCRISREQNGVQRMWLKEEPILFNPAVDLNILKSISLRNTLKTAHFLKIGQFLSEEGWISADVLAGKLGIRSTRLAQNILTQLSEALPVDYRLSLETHDEEFFSFPELSISADTGLWTKSEGGLLSFETPQLGLLRNVGKKALYVLCVKVLYLQTLDNVKESKWQEVFGADASPKGSWRSLYKPPTEKRTGDLQWRTVHGIIATNRHRAHLDPEVGEGCPFCGEQETIFHLFFNCGRLQRLFAELERWCQTLGMVFTPMVFVYGPRYSRSNKDVHVLINFLFGQVKMAIWLSRKGKLNDTGSTDVLSIVKGLIKTRIKIEYAYYKLVNNLEMFNCKWGINHCVCEVDIDGNLQVNI